MITATYILVRGYTSWAVLRKRFLTDTRIPVPGGTAIMFGASPAVMAITARGDRRC
jgi:hypothetical protein